LKAILNSFSSHKYTYSIDEKNENDYKNSLVVCTRKVRLKFTYLAEEGKKKNEICNAAQVHTNNLTKKPERVLV
jgi:hypothetical protein